MMEKAPNLPEQEPEPPLGPEAAEVLLDLWATTAGRADIFGPGTNAETPQEPEA